MESISPEKNLIIDSIIYPTYVESYQYDGKYNRSEVIKQKNDALLLVTTFGYDDVGNLISMVDANQEIKRYEYDNLNRLKKIINPDLTTNTYRYDNRDNLITVINEKQVAIRSYTYDRNNRKKTETWPTDKTMFYEFDENDNIVQMIDKKGQVSKYFYDDANRRVQKHLFNSLADTTPSKTIGFSYNKLDNLSGYDDGVTSAIYARDALQRVTGETINFGVFSKTISTTYYKNGLKKTFTGLDNVTLSYTYDAANRFSQLIIPKEGGINFSEYQWNAPKLVSYPGGLIRNVSYDPLMQVKQISTIDSAKNNLLDYVYMYDKVGNITSKTTEHGNYSYGYDDRYRLTSVKNPVISTLSSFVDEAFGYDEIGNRLTDSQTAGQWTYNTTNQLTS